MVNWKLPNFFDCKRIEEELPPTARCDTDNNAALMPSLSLCDAHDSMSSWMAYEQQLESYLKKPRLPRTTDIYAYWYSSEFPSLEPAAQKYFSAPPIQPAKDVSEMSQAGLFWVSSRRRRKKYVLKTSFSETPFPRFEKTY